MQPWNQLHGNGMLETSCPRKAMLRPSFSKWIDNGLICWRWWGFFEVWNRGGKGIYALSTCVMGRKYVYCAASQWCNQYLFPNESFLDTSVKSCFPRRPSTVSPLEIRVLASNAVWLVHIRRLSITVSQRKVQLVWFLKSKLQILVNLETRS